MMCCYIKDTDSIVFLYCAKIIQYTIKYESSTYRYKLVNYKVLAYSCTLNMCSTPIAVLIFYASIDHTSCTVISYYIYTISYLVLLQLTLSCRLVFHLLKTPVLKIIISSIQITCNKLY